jgi:adenylate cyclase
MILAAKYVMEERNKKFIRGAFSKYVAPAIVDSILKDPTKLSVGGDKKELTILFSDIRGFTTFSEQMDAKQLTHFLNDYLGIMTDIVFECGGTLDKYIGDAVMAFWGAPLDQPEHSANACKAAAKMMQALEKNKPRFKEQYGVEVNIGIGLNTGVVSVGNMGSDRIFEYTVIGDHVNLASRLEGLTKYYGVAIVTSRFTFDSISHAGLGMPPSRTLDFVKVKGKQKAVELIQVLEREFSADGIEIFRKGRELYAAQKWDAAIEEFRKSAELLAIDGVQDGPSVLFIERCKDFKKEPPASDWDGSWEMTSK